MKNVEAGTRNLMTEISDTRNLAVQSPRSTASDIQTALGAIGDDVSFRTMQRALNDAGCSAVKPQKKSYLSPGNIEKRYQWALQVFPVKLVQCAVKLVPGAVNLIHFLQMYFHIN